MHILKKMDEKNRLDPWLNVWRHLQVKTPTKKAIGMLYDKRRNRELHMICFSNALARIHFVPL